MFEQKRKNIQNQESNFWNLFFCLKNQKVEEKKGLPYEETFEQPERIECNCKIILEISGYLSFQVQQKKKV